MNNSISQKSELSEIKQEIILYSKELLNILKELFLFLYTHFVVWARKVGEDYTIENIKKHGLAEVLYRRAAIFFGVGEDQVIKGVVKRRKIARKIVRKTLLFPFYLLITLVHSLSNYQNMRKKNKKMGKKVNSYKT